jgi:spore germination protein
MFGYLFGMLVILTHLSGLSSFGVPYLSPFAATSVTGDTAKKDTMLRFPLFRLYRRPLYAKKDNRIRFRWKHPGKEHADEQKK